MILILFSFFSFSGHTQSDSVQSESLLPSPQWLTSDFKAKTSFNQLFVEDDTYYQTWMVGAHQSVEVQLIPKFALGINYGVDYLTSSTTNNEEFREIAVPVYLNTRFRLLKGNSFIRYLRLEYGWAPAISISRKTSNMDDFESLNSVITDDSRWPIQAGVKLGLGFDKTDVKDFIRLELGYEYRETNNPYSLVVNDYLSASILFRFF